MPFINIRIGKPLTAAQKATLADSIADNMSILPTKTRDNTMIEIDDDRTMFMGGEQRAMVFVDLRLYQASPMDTKQTFVKTLTDIFVTQLDIPADRQYYNLIELNNWGARGNFR